MSTGQPSRDAARQEVLPLTQLNVNRLVMGCTRNGTSIKAALWEFVFMYGETPDPANRW
jgi:hypothetical protein